LRSEVQDWVTEIRGPKSSANSHQKNGSNRCCVIFGNFSTSNSVLLKRFLLLLFHLLLLLSNAKLLYTSSKVYKEAGVAVEVVVADVVATTVVKLVDLRRRRVQKVGCRKNTACIEKKFQFPKIGRATFLARKFKPQSPRRQKLALLDRFDWSACSAKREKK
jgi:hypothetical protein